jgi:hypothetical protein
VVMVVKQSETANHRRENKSTRVVAGQGCGVVGRPSSMATSAVSTSRYLATQS